MTARKRKYSELVQPDTEASRDPLCVGCWVVVADPDLDRPLALALVKDGPSYEKCWGHAIGEVWALADGTRTPVGLLTRLDMADILREAREAAEVLRSSGPSKDVEITLLRVHRAACLARACRCDGATASDRSDLVELILLDRELTEAEDAWRQFLRSLPVLAHNLHIAGALWLARAPNWSPGDPAHPHPDWRDK